MPGTAYELDVEPQIPHTETKLYHLDPPLHSTLWGEQDLEYVVVYSTFFPINGAITYVLASDETGRIVSQLELEGSYEGGTDHAEALRRIGYEVEL